MRKHLLAQGMTCDEDVRAGCEFFLNDFGEAFYFGIIERLKRFIKERDICGHDACDCEQEPLFFAI